MNKFTFDQRRIISTLLLLIFTLIPLETLLVELGVKYETNDLMDNNVPILTIIKEEAISLENHPHAPETLPVGYFYNEGALAFGSVPTQLRGPVRFYIPGTV